MFWKGKNVKGANNDALLSDIQNKITLQSEFCLRIFPFFFSVIDEFFKNIYNYLIVNYEIRPE